MFLHNLKAIDKRVLLRKVNNSFAPVETRHLAAKSFELGLNHFLLRTSDGTSEQNIFMEIALLEIDSLLS